MNTINSKVIFCALLKLSEQLEQMQRGIFLVSAPHIQLYNIQYMLMKGGLKPLYLLQLWQARFFAEISDSNYFLHSVWIGIL